MITVLTPTYNREATLPRLYESLCAQTNKDFEWLVVDDGSQDDTQRLLLEYANIAPFKVHVFYQPNSGKHVALNLGVSKANTPWIFIVDSDDSLIASAVEHVIDAAIALREANAVGLCYRKAYFDMRLVGRDVERSTAPVIMKPTEAGHFFNGDLAYVFKTEAMLNHPFPVVSGERFVPELYIWNKIGDEGDIYCFGNTVLYLCDYLEDGYSKNFSSNLRRNPKGFLTFYWAQISRENNLWYKVKFLLRSIQCYFYTVLNRFS
ncbi:glycosyltransferase family A protein [Pseudomonas chlororaphis]|uniref:glycosyltransferase family A protein n=1 Tax=Pseudomonas chlororaphis TaxID=587753 RepID=UPI000F553CD9|nr:glycosyltransferase family 2 protein [Pseudomonas chlororaphis]AZD49883.1 putative beta-glycosyltransferase [Pseudomonas chlororaphis subsp. aurantiaca]